MMVFTAVANLGSFTKAGEQLGLGRARVSQIVGQLEHKLNVKLLNRTTRSLSLTEIGGEYLEKCRLIYDLAEEANAIAQDAQESVSGVLRIKVPVGGALITPVVAAFLRAHPDVRVDLVESDTAVDLTESRIDVAFMSGPLADSTLRTVPMGSIFEILCASREYLDEHGTPGSVQDLARLDWVCHYEEQKSGSIRIRQSGATNVKLKLKPKVVATSVLAIKSFIVNGAGFGVLPSAFVMDELKSGQIVRILPEFQGYDIPLLAVYGYQNMVPLKVRVFLDFIKANITLPDT